MPCEDNAETLGLQGRPGGDPDMWQVEGHGASQRRWACAVSSAFLLPAQRHGNTAHGATAVQSARGNHVRPRSGMMTAVPGSPCAYTGPGSQQALATDRQALPNHQRLQQVRPVPEQTSNGNQRQIPSPLLVGHPQDAWGHTLSPYVLSLTTRGHPHPSIPLATQGFC